MKTPAIIGICLSTTLIATTTSGMTSNRGCTTTITDCPPTVTPAANATPVSCGASTTISIGQSVNWGFQFAPGGVGGRVGGSITVTQSYSVTSGECEECRLAVGLRGYKLKKTECWIKPFWPWNDPYLQTTFEVIPGSASISKLCESSPEISCMCKAAGNDCACDPAGGIGTAGTSGQSPAVPRSSTSFDIAQFRATDASMRYPTRLAELSRHDLHVLRHIAASPLNNRENELFILVFDADHIESHSNREFDQIVAAIDEELVDGGKFLDVDGNGDLDDRDLSIVLANFGGGREPSEPFDHFADLDANGVVDEVDVMIISNAL